MLTTKRKPASVGEILIEEFMEPMGLTQGALAEAMGVQCKFVNSRANLVCSGHFIRTIHDQHRYRYLFGFDLQA
jgi:hypothetical protein